MKLAHLAAAAFYITFPAKIPAETAEPGKQSKQEFKTELEGKTVSMAYWLALPKKDTEAKSAPPLVLFLHGAGERGANLDVVAKHGPPKLIESNEWLQKAIVVSPQCPEKQWWDTKVLKKLCDDVVKAHAADPNRIYLTGLSMGGYGSWTLLAEYPDYWSAAIPICGGGKPETAPKFKHVPIWVFHGTEDQAVKLKLSEDMVAALKSAGGEPKFTVYKGVGHDSWTAAYADAETWKWLFAQTRKPSATP